MTTEKDWLRLAEAVRVRRARLRLSQAALAQRGPLSRDRLQKIEGAKLDYCSPNVLAALEHALGWKEGSVEAVLSGGDPVLKAPAAVEHAPGVQEHVLPDDVLSRLPDDGKERHSLKLSIPGEEGVVFVSWTRRLPPDLRAITEDIKAQSRLLDRRAQVEQESDRDRDLRNDTDE